MGDTEGEEGEPQNEVLTLDMGATMIESEIEKSLVMMKGYYFKKGKNELINELRGLMSLMREKKLEEGRSLNYFISEVLEIVHNARSQLENDSDDINEIVECLRQTKRLLQEEGWRSEEYGVWEGEVVGVEEDVKLLLHKIDMSQEMPWVGWIRGMVGSGKTTLAKLVYNHPDVVHKFELRVWVNCRKFISLKELVINIIQQVGGDEDYPQGKAAVEMDCADLITMLGKRLSDKRFFLVLDHIGECQFWVDIIALYLRNHAKAEEGSILLVTSHTTNHLNVVGDYEHAMKALDPDKSWQLLMKKMLRIDDKFPKKAERKGKLVLMKHTGGLPFAIKEAAMEWAEKRSRGIEWEAIVDSDDLELKSTLEAIDLSFYYMLEPGVKFTFLHLGLFKLGEAISNQKFQQTFVASGVVESFPSNDLNNNYRHLEKIKIIQFKFKDILVNPIYHKLSITKAKKGNDGAHIGVIYCSRERFNGSTDQNEGQLICLSFKGGGYLDDSPTYWKCFEQLRVLDFEGFGLRFLPEMVGELMELRYLGLRNNYTTELPCSLGNLKRLEVLDIAHNFMVKVHA